MNKLTLLICFLVNTLGFSQTKMFIPPSQTNLDFNLAVGQGGSIGAAYSRLVSISKNNRFKIGYGIRMTKYISQRQSFITAPAQLTSGTTGPTVLFSNYILENIDTLSIARSAILYTNLKVGLQYTIGRLDIGFDIDVMGFSLGNKQNADLNGKTTEVSPKPFNVLLIGDNDIGSLNSEFYLRYWLDNRFALRAGLSYQFLEYKTAQSFAGNDRFRNKIAMPFVALTFAPFKWVWNDVR